MKFIFHIWDVILPIDELTFFKMVGQPPTMAAMIFHRNPVKSIDFSGQSRSEAPCRFTRRLGNKRCRLWGIMGQDGNGKSLVNGGFNGKSSINDGKSHSSAGEGFITLPWPLQ